MDLDAHIAERLAALVPAQAPVCVGFSGGLDSTVLLELLARAGGAQGRAVRALHVHHGLSPHADAWTAACERSCRALGVALDVVRVRVARDAGRGLEAAAREARYAAYAERAEPFVALAHHRDDQAETVLLQLLRGTGLKGAAGMPQRRALPGSGVSIVRPLLAVPRSALRDHALSRGLAWVEDESNASAAHDRNYLRHEVAPRLDARFDGWREALARFARHAAGAEGLLDALARIDGVPEHPGEPLPLAAGADRARSANALRAFLAVNGLPMPDGARLAEMARQLYAARADARVRIDHGGAQLVRHRASLHVLREAPAGAWRVPWRGEARVALADGLGEVAFEPVTGAGIARAAAARGSWHLAPRAGGERLRLAAGGRTRTLKNLLRESGMPPWERERLPLLFAGERLAWVPGVGVAAEYACPEGAPGWRPCWRVAGRTPVC